MKKRALAVVLLLLVGMIVISAFVDSYTPNSFFYSDKDSRSWHDAKDVNVLILGAQKSLQQAIDDKDIGVCGISELPVLQPFPYGMPSGSHTSLDVDVNIGGSGGTRMTLQEAIDRGYLGGGYSESGLVYPANTASGSGHSASEIMINLNGVRKSLQQAIDEGNFPNTLCQPENICDYEVNVDGGGTKQWNWGPGNQICPHIDAAYYLVYRSDSLVPPVDEIQYNVLGSPGQSCKSYLAQHNWLPYFTGLGYPYFDALPTVYDYAGRIRIGACLYYDLNDNPWAYNDWSFSNSGAKPCIGIYCYDTIAHRNSDLRSTLWTIQECPNQDCIIN